VPLVLCLSVGFRCFPCVCCAGVCALLSARPVLVACSPLPSLPSCPCLQFPLAPLHSALMDGWMWWVHAVSQPARPPAVTPL